MMTSRFPLLFVLLFALGLFPVRVEAASRPNVLFVFVDDMGYGDMGAYGCTDIETPNLDRLASSGLRLTRGYVTSPYCGPSRAGVMTGRYQQRHGFWHNPGDLPPDLKKGLDLDEETLGNVMQRAGYRTAAIGKWHLGASEQFHPINRGFEEFFGFLGGGHNYWPHKYEDLMRGWSRDHSKTRTPYLYNYGTPLQVNGIDLPTREGYLTDILTEYAVGFMNRMQKDPFFLYLAYNAPHTPLEAPEELIEKYAGIKDDKRRAYAAMVDNLDQNIGKMLDHLEETGRLGNTIIVFASDNGGNNREGADNGPLKHGKGYTHEGGIRVPFLIAWPDVLPAGKVFDVPISTLDLLPTFAAAAGVEPAGKLLDGVNVLPWLRGEAEGIPHEALFWERVQNGRFGMLEGDWKLVRPKADADWELYNVRADEGEENNLADQHPDRVKAMQARHQAWFDSLEPARWTDPRY